MKLDYGLDNKESACAMKEEALTLEVRIGWEQVEKSLYVEEVLTRWDELLEKDSVTTFFQTPLWCVTWYRCYKDQFEPLLLLVERNGRLVGLAPLANERDTGRTVFAGDRMADYRDFICEDQFKCEIISLFLSKIMSITTTPYVVIGHTQPESKTKGVVCQWASMKYGVIVRTHPCWRFLLTASNVGRLLKKENIRRHFNFYKRNGGLEFRQITDKKEWNAFRQNFFTQHTMRQLFAGRPTSFQDARKQAFYDQLFKSLSSKIHFSMLRANERIIAFHYGFSYRRTLYFGAPSYDLLENKHAPGILHMTEIIRDCLEKGYDQVDLTLGDTTFKERLGNTCVELPTIYIYKSRWKYWSDLMIKVFAEQVKTILRRLLSSDGVWESLKERLGGARNSFDRLRNISPFRLISLAFRYLFKLVHHSNKSDVFRLTSNHLCKVSPLLDESDKVNFRGNHLEDLLTLEGDERRHLTTMLQEAVKRIGQGHELHTVLLNGRLAHYGWSHYPSEPIYLPETQTFLTLPPGALALYDFYTTESYRGKRLYPANLFRIASLAFNKGVTDIYITCEAQNSASRRGIQSVGFCRCGVHAMQRFLGMKRQRVEEEPPIAG